MSTKGTLSYSNEPDQDYHLYTEALDCENVYLRIKDGLWMAELNNITLKIPRKIWNKIIEVGELEFVDDLTVAGGLIDNLFPKKNDEEDSE